MNYLSLSSIYTGRKIVQFLKVMKKNILLILITFFNFSCSNGKVDERKLDQAGEKVQKSVKKVVDTAGSKIEKLKIR